MTFTLIKFMRILFIYIGKQIILFSSIFILLMLIRLPVHAHVVVGELENMSKSAAAFTYLSLGFKHIIPLGLDHIFFILSLFLLSPNLKSILFQSTAFTLAHSVTLGLTMFHVINPPSQIIEPLIALSIVYVAVENIISSKLRPARLGIVFLFGLVHGMGFAGALGQLGLPKDAFLLSLVMFNIGIELGQLIIILSAFFLLSWFLKNPKIYRQRIVIPISLIIACIAGLWTFQRLFI